MVKTLCTMIYSNAINYSGDAHILSQNKKTCLGNAMTKTCSSSHQTLNGNISPDEIQILIHRIVRISPLIRLYYRFYLTL